MTGETARDAASAAVPLLCCLLVAWWRGRSPSVPALVVGAAGALALELLLSRRQAAVRRVWERPAVRWGATGAALVVLAAVVALRARVALWVAVGGLTAYLVLLAAATVRRRE